MLKLKKLHFSNIGRFVEEQVIDFEPLGNLIQVDGENRNTGGSSGSGKSTIFNALDYLLGLNDLPLTVLQSRLTKDPITVMGEFDFNGLPLIISRSKKGLSVSLNGEITEGSSKITEEKLDQIIGIPRDLFRKMLHKRQKEGGFFLDFTPKQMYEFLTDCLELSSVRNNVEKIDKNIQEYTELSINKNALKDRNLSAIKATQEAILALGLSPIKDVHQSTILELKQKYDIAIENFKKTQEGHENETKELEKERPQISTPIFCRKNQESLEIQRKELNDRINGIILAERDRQSKITATISEKSNEQTKLRYSISEGETAKVNAKEIAQQIKKIRDAICPTCDQSWVNESAKTKESELLGKLSTYKEKISNTVLDIEKFKILEIELNELKKQFNPIVDLGLADIQKQQKEILLLIEEEKKKNDDFYFRHNQANQAILKEFADKQSFLKQKQFTEIGQVRGQMDIGCRVFESATQKLKAYEDARSRYESSLSQLKQQEQTSQTEFDRAIKEHEEIKIKLDVAQELKKAIKLFLSCSFDDALDAIGDAATRIIRCIPNMSHATIQFEGQKETKDGKIKEEVNAVISSDGEVGIPIKSLSGGERSAVDLAVDLAVIDFMESKTGVGADLVILDEPFTGLDSTSVEMVLEVLKNSNINKKIIIVDHNPIIKEHLENRIVVTREGQTSNVTQ